MKPVVFIISVLLLVVCLELYISSNHIQITHLSVPVSNCPDAFEGFKIVHLSDLHSKRFGRENARLIGRIFELEPDIVVMTGDMVNRTDKDFGVFLNLAAALAKTYPVYYVTGNHELGLNIKALTEIKAQLKSFGVCVLDNEQAVIRKGRDAITLYGCALPLEFYREMKSRHNREHDFDIIKDALGDFDDYGVNILLAHHPRYFEIYSDWGAALTLSGHLHGGMIRLPFIGAVFSPDIELFPNYGGGLYTNRQSHMVVNRGLGRGTAGFRLFNRPEISVITLHGI
ncbi:MAG: putative metallophosphoesterase [Firmicutes bacterium ADurb.Bin182]|nr:MAG: putative metallophosphoesterase [Firmicutes bacterium ADurb.Bin182]